MIYSIYIPGKSGANKRHLADVGLAELLRDGDASAICTDLLAGPDGQPGQIWTWDEGKNIAAYQPDRQRWEPSYPDPGLNLPAGRFWWGFSTEPLTETDLRRGNVIDGKSITLRGEQWLVPNVLNLPETFAFDSTGQVVRQPIAAFRPFVEDCEWAISQILEVTGGPPSMDVWRRELDVAVRFLAVNYRINRELAVRLELLKPEELFQVILRGLDQQRLRSLMDALKNPEGGAQTPAGSAVSAGPGA